jgi:hypothetical protein
MILITAITTAGVPRRVLITTSGLLKLAGRITNTGDCTNVTGKRTGAGATITGKERVVEAAGVEPASEIAHPEENYVRIRFVFLDRRLVNRRRLAAAQPD